MPDREFLRRDLKVGLIPDWVSWAYLSGALACFTVILTKLGTTIFFSKFLLRAAVRLSTPVLPEHLTLP